jgi:3-oxoacyl-[acyl-carrier-protein] synthase III
MFMVAGGENLTTLSVEAARKALEMAKVDPGDVDLILVCSSTSDDLFGTGPQVSIGYRCIITFYFDYITPIFI